MQAADSSVTGLVDHLFRTRAGQMVAYLTRVFGAAHVELAEEVVQDALVKALQQWPFQGVPEHPDAWLLAVARNKALDRVRRTAVFRDKVPHLTRELDRPAGVPDSRFAHEIADDQLRLIFLCCHPAISVDARVALSLKLVAGFGVGEIARAFLQDEATIAQRLVRAKRQLRAVNAGFDVPQGADLDARLPVVLEGLYLLFNEGYGAWQGDDLVRTDLVGEAIRLTRALAGAPATSRPIVHALAALMLLQAGRLPARTDAAGDLVLLGDQDRSRWDRALLHAGLRHLDQAAEGDQISEYHLQAAIAAIHAQAADAASTDWPAILSLYDQLASVSASPVVLLNRAVALGMASSASVGLDALTQIATHPSMTHYYLFHATRADLLTRVGRASDAAEAYERALACACTEPERRFLMRRLAAIEL